MTVPGEGRELALRLRGVSKTFPGVRALVDVDFDVRPGSVHALVGHNGSGKSTLIKCLAGVHAPDPGGEAWVSGQPLALGDAHDAEEKGLRFVHQDLGIFMELSLNDNIGFVAGYKRSRFGGISWRRQARRAHEMLKRFDFDLDPDAPVGELSPPERTAVAIVRAVANWPEHGGVLVLDEPTASLPNEEVARLFDLIREISGSGASVVLVSHRLDEVIDVADHVTAMRDGRKVWDGPMQDVTLKRLVDLVSGSDERESTADARLQPPQSDVVLETSDLSGIYLRGVNMTVAAGEIVGVAGLLGSGREELPYVVSGARSLGVSGAVRIGGATLPEFSIAEARRLGVVLVPADRLAEGVIDGFSTVENVSLGALDEIRSGGILRPAAERQFAGTWMTTVQADLAYAPRPILTLSGGNQQKIVLARALSVSPRLLVLSEPTAGVDIGARQVFYDATKQAASNGLSVLMASSDVEDLLACCHRVIALRDGHVVGEFQGDQMTKSAISYAIEGAHHE